MASTEQVIRLLKRKKTANMEALRDALGGCSRRSVFRYLERVGYLSSFTHAGRYYTLESTARFGCGSFATTPTTLLAVVYDA